MKNNSVDMMTKLINTGVKQQKVSNKQSDSSSDRSDFEKMLEQAGQQQGFTAGDTSESSSSSSDSVTVNGVTGETEPGVEQLSIAAALITVQPMVPVDTITPVEVADIAPAGVEAVVMPEEAGAVVQQVAAAPVLIQEEGQQQQPVMAEVVPEEEIIAPEMISERPVEAVAQEAQPEAEQQQQMAEELPTEHRTVEAKASDNSEEVVVEDASAAAEAPVFEGTETVPVKVAETVPETVEPEAEDAAQKLAQHIERAIVQGESTVELSLTPASLGQLTVEITRSGDGNLSIVLTTVTDKAANLLDRHVTNLQHMLADNAQNVHIEVESRTQQSQAQQFLNPDGEANHQHRQQQHQKQEEEHDSGDFLQQLRLGLVELE